MNLNELKASLTAARPDSEVRIALPDGGYVPAHFHVTEVGHIQKDFIDCGGQRRASRTCSLQIWMGSEHDDGHRLTVGRFGKILALTAPLFADEALPVEVEYEDGFISQFPLERATVDTDRVVLQLGSKHTNCLARETCGAGGDDGGCGCGDPERKTAACC
jgi:hypothetical protein